MTRFVSTTAYDDPMTFSSEGDRARSRIDHASQCASDQDDGVGAHHSAKENLVDAIVVIGDETVTNYQHAATRAPVDFPPAPKQPQRRRAHEVCIVDVRILRSSAVVGVLAACAAGFYAVLARCGVPREFVASYLAFMRDWFAGALVVPTNKLLRRLPRGTSPRRSEAEPICHLGCC